MIKDYRLMIIEIAAIPSSAGGDVRGVWGEGRACWAFKITALDQRVRFQELTHQIRTHEPCEEVHDE